MVPVYRRCIRYLPYRQRITKRSLVRSLKNEIEFITPWIELDWISTCGMIEFTSLCCFTFIVSVLAQGSALETAGQSTLCWLAHDKTFGALSTDLQQCWTKRLCAVAELIREMEAKICEFKLRNSTKKVQQFSIANRVMIYRLCSKPRFYIFQSWSCSLDFRNMKTKRNLKGCVTVSWKSSLN